VTQQYCCVIRPQPQRHAQAGGCWADAEQGKAYKAGAEADEAEGYRAAACEELQDVKTQLVRARCGEDDYRCRAKRLATENEVLSNIVEKAIRR
jgi:hypothetical protein